MKRMDRKSFKTIVFLLLTLKLMAISSLEPITLTILGAVGLGAIVSKWDYLKCSTSECCHKLGAEYLTKKGWSREPWIDYQVKQLSDDLNREVHGQHLVKQIIPKLIEQHMKNENPEKALVLSFHGWTGGGKNFVSDIVAKNIFRKYRKSGESDFVRHFFCSHFNTEDKQLIREWIKNNITNVVKTCQRSLFIFDEIDKLPEGVIDIIKPFVDHNKFVDSIDYTKTIFILLSNTGGTGITKKTYEFYKQGKEQTDLKMKDFESLIGSGAFNENGGLNKSDIVDKNLIDAYIPFLPLEKKHVRRCVIDYLKLHHNKVDPLKDPGREFIRDIADEMEYQPPDTQLYSRTGCKRVRTKVDALID